MAYSVLGFPLAFAGLPIYVHAPEFYARTFGISISVLGLILLLVRGIDAIQDPLIGALSDRFHEWRSTIIVFGLTLLGIGFWMLFHPIQSLTIPWLVTSLILCTTGFSVASINFQALGGLWKADEKERTRIVSWREAAGLLGLLVASIAPTILANVNREEQAFHWITIFFVPLLIICGLVFLSWMKRSKIDKPKKPKSSEKRPIFNTPWNRQFFSIYLINSFASAIPAILVVFFVSDRLDAKAYLGVFLLLYFLSGVISMPFWQFLSNRIGKLNAWLVSMLVASLTFIWAFGLSTGEIQFFAAVCVFSGMALGGDLALPPSIVADRISRLDLQDAASRYFSGLTFLGKLSLAVASGFSLPLLSILGYEPGGENGPNVTAHLSTVYALIPSLTKMVVAFWLFCFIRQIYRGKYNYEIRSDSNVFLV